MDIPQTLQYLRPGANWTLNGDSYEGLHWHGPGDPPTLAELETAWTEMQAVRRWPDARSFLDAFTPEEKAAISLSTDATVAYLRLELLTWNGPVHADDARVIAGLDRLVTVGILTTQRREEVVAL